MAPEERFTKIENLLAKLTESQIRHEAEIEKQNAAIRDVILVSRTTLTAIDDLRKAQKELQEKQKVTEDKLHALIETVDRMIRDRQN